MAEPEAQLSRERRRKVKAPMGLLVSAGVAPQELVLFTIFRKEREPTAQPPIIKDETVLVIPTQIPDTCTKKTTMEKRENGLNPCGK